MHRAFDRRRGASKKCAQVLSSEIGTIYSGRFMVKL